MAQQHVAQHRIVAHEFVNVDGEAIVLHSRLAVFGGGAGGEDG